MHKIFTPAGQQTIEHRPEENDLDINSLLTILLTCYHAILMADQQF